MKNVGFFYFWTNLLIDALVTLHLQTQKNTNWIYKIKVTENMQTQELSIVRNECNKWNRWPTIMTGFIIILKSKKLYQVHNTFSPNILSRANNIISRRKKKDIYNWVIYGPSKLQKKVDKIVCIAGHRASPFYHIQANTQILWL